MSLALLLNEANRQEPEVDSLEMRDKHGRTPLLGAVKDGNITAVRLLLDHGAQVETSVHGKTALMMASERGQEAVVRLSIDRGPRRTATPSAAGPRRMAAKTYRNNTGGRRLRAQARAFGQTRRVDGVRDAAARLGCGCTRSPRGGLTGGTRGRGSRVRCLWSWPMSID